MNVKKVYLNKKQLAFCRSTAKRKAFIGGRGSGKSTTIGPSVYDKARLFPRGKQFFAALTYNQILTKTIPAVEQFWSQIGLKEHIHYVIGQKPPKHFATPLAPSRKHKNIITFFNGYTIEMLSLDRMDLARGGSYDSGDIDEAALIPRERFSKILSPSVRGNLHIFKHPLHHSISIYTSMPWKPSGYWVLEWEKKMQEDPKRYFYLEATAWDNVDVLGEEQIRMMEADMTFYEAQVELHNKRIVKVDGAFYHAFNADTHCYTPKYQYDDGPRGIHVKGPTDVDKDKLIDLTFDFGGWFSGCIALQERNNKEYALRRFYVKDDNKVSDLVAAFCDNFKNHQFKYVRIWGEPRGHDKQPTGGTIYEQIQDEFTRRGWTVDVRVTAMRTPLHEVRHANMNYMLSEEDTQMVKLRINQDYCKDVIISMQTTQVKEDYKKNKKSERDREFPQEHAPHFSDMLDYYFEQKHGWKFDRNSSFGPKSIDFL